jgi:hydroxyethylthiazole kinase-like uncharacterized protein yjeF
MNFPEIKFTPKQALELEQFREMDYYAVENYNLPIELMMENAGLHLARLVSTVVQPVSSIKIGVGNGNNGGGGLVAARRLSAWGFLVYLDFFTEITKPLPLMQLERALKFGTKKEPIENPDVWIDAYLGFSQKLPLALALNQRMKEANSNAAIKISLDIPTGFLREMNSSVFNASKILTLAAPKKILLNLPSETAVYVADLGIPDCVYKKFGITSPPFHKNSIIQLKR